MTIARFLARFIEAPGDVRLTGTVEMTTGIVDGPVVLSPSDKDAAALTIKPVTGATADGSIEFEIDDDAGNQLVFIDAAGDVGFNLPSANGAFIAFQRDGVTIMEVSASSSGFVSISPSGRLDLGSAVINMPALPAADPHVVGQLWNSAGTLKVSAG